MNEIIVRGSAMSAVSTSPNTLGAMLRRLGDIPPDRIRMQPPPGIATVGDVAENQLCELIDGVLVEKAMGWRESYLAMWLCRALIGFVKPRNLGVVTGPDSTQQISASLVRMPDVSFFSWERLPGRKIPVEPVPFIVPDLAAEVLSKGNTPKEMSRKREEYFKAGVRLVWIIDPVARTVDVYTSATEHVTLTEADELTGGDVLPGFSLSLRELFGELDVQG